MKISPVLLLVLLAFVGVSYCKDLLIGDSFNARLRWQHKVEKNGIPFIRRVKEVFFSDPDQKLIKAIIARDLDHSDAIASVTAGGVGFSYANIKLKSHRGSRLNYQLGIYV